MLCMKSHFHICKNATSWQPLVYMRDSLLNFDELLEHCKAWFSKFWREAFFSLKMVDPKAFTPER